MIKYHYFLLFVAISFLLFLPGLSALLMFLVLLLQLFSLLVTNGFDLPFLRTSMLDKVGDFLSLSTSYLLAIYLTIWLLKVTSNSLKNYIEQIPHVSWVVLALGLAITISRWVPSVPRILVSSHQLLFREDILIVGLEHQEFELCHKQ